MMILKKLIRRIVNHAFHDYAFIDPQSQIGKHTFIGKGTTITKAVVGNYCSIAQEVYIGPGEHPMRYGSTSSELFEGDVYDTLTKKDVVIGHDVWIGVRAIVLRGVTIGTGAVIGAGAIVTKDVPPYAIVAGVPAKIIRYRFSHDSMTRLLDSKWWELGIEDAKKTLASLGLQGEEPKGYCGKM